MSIARDHVDRREIKKAGNYLNSGFARIRPVLVEESSEMLPDIFQFITLFQMAYFDVAMKIIYQFADMSLYTLKGSHPLKQLFAQLRSLDITDVEQTAQMAANYVTDL